MVFAGVYSNLDDAKVVEELRPTLVAWVVSFLITGMFWVEHRDLFSRVRTVNRDLVC
jgi:uncharacterized membrane protein